MCWFRRRARYSFTRVVPVPPAVVWEMLNSPTQRPRWQTGVTAVLEDSEGGRRGVGTTNHCVHGKDAVVEEIVDWRPFDYVTKRSTLPLPGAPRALMSIVLRPVDDGTEVTYRMAPPRSAKARAEMAPLAEGYVLGLEAGFDKLLAELAATPADNTVEPDVPASVGRFIANPVVAGPR